MPQWVTRILLTFHYFDCEIKELRRVFIFSSLTLTQMGAVIVDHLWHHSFGHTRLWFHQWRGRGEGVSLPLMLLQYWVCTGCCMKNHPSIDPHLVMTWYLAAFRKWEKINKSCQIMAFSELSMWAWMLASWGEHSLDMYGHRTHPHTSIFSGTYAIVLARVAFLFKLGKNSGVI